MWGHCECWFWERTRCRAMRVGGNFFFFSFSFFKGWGDGFTSYFSILCQGFITHSLLLLFTNGLSSLNAFVKNQMGTLCILNDTFATVTFIFLFSASNFFFLIFGGDRVGWVVVGGRAVRCSFLCAGQMRGGDGELFILNILLTNLGLELFKCRDMLVDVSYLHCGRSYTL